MPAESLKLRLQDISDPRTKETVRIALAALLDGVQAAFAQLTAKLDADAGVTDVNYASTNAAILNAIIID
jgi:hypothetical protein